MTNSLFGSGIVSQLTEVSPPLSIRPRAVFFSREATEFAKPSFLGHMSSNPHQNLPPGRRWSRSSEMGRCAVPKLPCRVHYGADGEEFNRELIERLAELEDVE